VEKKAIEIEFDIVRVLVEDKCHVPPMITRQLELVSVGFVQRRVEGIPVRRIPPKSVPINAVGLKPCAKASGRRQLVLVRGKEKGSARSPWIARNIPDP